MKLTPEEIAILRPEYEQYMRVVYADYMARYLSFDEWWRARADNAKEQAKV